MEEFKHVITAGIDFTELMNRAKEHNIITQVLVHNDIVFKAMASPTVEGLNDALKSTKETWFMNHHMQTGFVAIYSKTPLPLVVAPEGEKLAIMAANYLEWITPKLEEVAAILLQCRSGKSVVDTLQSHLMP